MSAFAIFLRAIRIGQYGKMSVMNTKEIVRDCLSRVFVGTQLGKLSRRFFINRGAVIFYGHRVEDNDEGYLQGLSPVDFEKQMLYLRKNYQFLPLSELLHYFEKSKTIPDNTVVLTFDDGFRDNYINALPVLERLQIPATIFLTTECISSGELPWSQKLGYIFQNTKKETVSFADIQDYNIQHARSRKQVYAQIFKILSRLSFSERNHLILELSEQLSVHAPIDRMLTWEDVALMMKKGIEFGAHTFSHSLLAEINFEDAVWEMQKSKADLKDKLEIDNPSFCFPGGSINKELIQAARDIGFRSIFKPERRKRVNNLENSDNFSLNRLGLPNASASHLETELDGPFHFLRNIYRR